MTAQRFWVYVSSGGTAARHRHHASFRAPGCWCIQIIESRYQDVPKAPGWRIGGMSAGAQGANPKSLGTFQRVQREPPFGERREEFSDDVDDRGDGRSCLRSAFSREWCSREWRPREWFSREWKAEHNVGRGQKSQDGGRNKIRAAARSSLQIRPRQDPRSKAQSGSVGKHPWRGNDAVAVQFESAATKFKIVHSCCSEFIRESWIALP